SRTLPLIARHREGIVPDGDAPPELVEAFDGLTESVCARLDAFDLTGGLDEIWAVVRRMNQYVQDQQPWQIAKEEGADARLDSVLYGLAEGLRVVSLLVHAYIPDSSRKLLAALGHDDVSLDSASFGAVGGGARLGELGQLFPKI